MPFGALIYKLSTTELKITENAAYVDVGWLVGCIGFNGPLKQYFSLYRAVFQREGERVERKDRGE